MDLELEADKLTVVRILEKLGFKIALKGADSLEAKMPYGFGRMHVLGQMLDYGKFYLDVHWDFYLHFLFLGVDYANRPGNICEKIIEEASRLGVKAYVIGGLSWFSRKNKSLIRGLKI